MVSTPNPNPHLSPLTSHPNPNPNPGARGACLQFVLAQQDTGLHCDNGGSDTWMRLIAGKVLNACWSLEDGLRHGLNDDVLGAEMDWSKFKRLPSARLLLMPIQTLALTLTLTLTLTRTRTLL